MTHAHTGAQRQQPRDTLAGMDGTHTLTAAGHRVSVTLAGRGRETVVLLHGIPGSRHTWAKVVPLLSPRFRVVVPDLLGFGDSEAPREDFHAPGQAAMVLGLLDALGVERCHLVGADFGGPVALTLLARAPARVASLTLAATNAFTDTPIPGPLKVAHVPGLGEAAFRAFFGRTGLSLMWRFATGDRQAFPYRDFRPDLASPSGVAWTRRIFLASLRDLPGRYGEVEAALGRVAVPATVLWGDRDPFFPRAVGERTAAAIPDARFVLLPGCGHFVAGERPGALAAEVEAVVARAQARAG